MINKPKKIFARYRQQLIITSTVILGIISLINFYFLFVIAPISNDECLWVHKKLPNGKVEVVFSLVKFKGVTWDAGIRDGDKLLSINGINAKNTKQAQSALNQVASGDSAVYKVSRNGKIFKTKVRIKKLYNFQGIGYNLLGFIWLIVGFIVVMAKKDGHTQQLFYRIGALFILVALSSFSSTIRYLQHPSYTIAWLITIGDILWLFGACYLPFALVHFFWIFPKRSKIIDKKYTIKVLYITPTILFVLLLLIKISSGYLETGYLFKTPFYFILFYGFPALLIFTGFVIGLISLFRSYLKLETKQEKKSIFIILIAYTVGVTAIIYTATLANALAETIYNSPEYFMPIIVVAIIPIAFGYSIFRYSLMDVSVVLKNAIFYGAATIALAVIYFIIIFVLGQQISLAVGSNYQGITAAAIFIVFAFIFQSTKDRFQNAITKRFYPEQFAAQKVLLKFSNDIASTVGLDNILDSTTASFIDALHITHFGIFIKKYGGNVFELVRQKGIRLQKWVVPDTEQQLLDIIEQKQNMRLHPVIEQNEFKEVFPENFDKFITEKIYTIIPLKIKSRIIGFLTFGLKHSGAQFAGKDLELLVAAAYQVAVAIENARLYQSEAEKLKLEQELEQAKKIQNSLLPKNVPVIKGLDLCGTMIPAMQVGGDYYDLIQISDSKIFVVIGDVSGKGLSASFYMSKLQTMIRLYCTEENSPKEILQKINKRIYDSIEKNWFITVSVALFDTRENKMNYCRAGHTPLIVIENGKVTQFQPKGIGLGLEKGKLFDSTIEELELHLHKNQLFVFYSDGITEAMNNSKKLFSLERFYDVLISNTQKECNVIIENILNSINNFKNDAVQNDDITLVILKTTD